MRKHGVKIAVQTTEDQKLAFARKRIRREQRKAEVKAKGGWRYLQKCALERASSIKSNTYSSAVAAREERARREVHRATPRYYDQAPALDDWRTGDW